MSNIQLGRDDLMQFLTRATGGGAGGRGSGKGAFRSPKWTLKDQAKICGWNGTNNISDIPNIWFEMEECEDEDELRKILEDAMYATAAAYTIELDSFYLSDTFIKALAKLDFVPMGSEEVLFELLEKGLSCLAFALQTAKEQIASKTTDQQRREHVPTFTEAEAFRKGDPRSPPKSYTDMLDMITPYAVFLLTLFSLNNDHCAKVWALRQAFRNRKSQKEAFVWDTWRKTTFKMIEDSRQYFRVTMRPQQLQGHLSTLMFPASHLGPIVSMIEQGMNFDCIMHNIPDRWGASSGGAPRGNAAAASGGGASYWGTGGGGGGGPSGGGGAQNSHQRESGAGSFGVNGGKRQDGSPRPAELYTGGVHYFVHSIIEKVFRPYLDRFGRVNVKSLRESVSLKHDDLPGKTAFCKFVHNKRISTLCYKFCMGCCDTENCRFDHLYPNELGDGFANELVDKMGPAVSSAMSASGDMGGGGGGRGGGRGGGHDGRGGGRGNKRNYSQRRGGSR